MHQYKSSESTKEIIENLKPEQLWKQTNVLNYLKDFYRDDKSTVKDIETQLNTEEFQNLVFIM